VIAGLSALGARYLQENVADGSVVGVNWSSTVYHVVSARYLREKSNVTVVQLMGSIGGSIAELDGVSVTARLADALGAKAHYLHAPMLVADAVVREGLMHDPHIRKTLEVARGADTMMVSVGAIDHKLGAIPYRLPRRCRSGLHPGAGGDRGSLRLLLRARRLPGTAPDGRTHDSDR